ncbi:hypothetical protein Glove_226g37 [Diversispora epigaea]|uniref:LIM zinc-binding domain-containing protein n=1 Tax=Diversispora epigaea TaxID=1348612 RepID=A0A397IHM1_9GLOM|nr:hypothetical protein Glove_226g37 [Diversispora epigaea]
MTSRYGGAPLCSRCEKVVYMAEQVIGPNGPWHRACLTCIECKKRLDSFALAEHEGEAYCKMCHGRRFGPKGYGFASGTAFLSTENAKPLNMKNKSNNLINRRSTSPIPPSSSPLSSSSLTKDELNSENNNNNNDDNNNNNNDDNNNNNNDNNNNNNDNLKLSQSPPRSPSSLSSSSTYSTSTISSISSSSTISNNSNGNSSYGFFSTRSYSSPRGSLINGGGAMGVGGGGPKRSWTLPANNDICPRCTKPVYAAESVLGAGVKYHRLCLRCVSCSKLLDSGNMTDRDNKIYCCPCYSKEFGPKGYGYGGGAAFLTTEGAR